jgi:4-hydroxythreonine-4-phosphate dehydrogenase
MRTLSHSMTNPSVQAEGAPHASGMAARRPIAITLGDPCGIGPEIVLKAFAAGLPAACVVIGDVGLLRRESERLRLGLSIQPIASPGALRNQAVLADPADPLSAFSDAVPVIATTALPEDLAQGALRAEGGEAAYRYVCRAAELALRGEVRAIVTAPLAKEALHLAGHHWPGHTELLAHLAGDVPVRMMLANNELRTVLVTIHLALRAALDALSADGILETLRITHGALTRMGIDAPRIAVAGVNPHAGESGLFGREEIDLIAPVIARARTEGINAQGPYAPDTVFMRARGFKQFDVVIAMYHDQGLIPVKYMGLDEGVNITIGLPFVRTSPDHGTAFDIAGQPGEHGTGLADPRSLLAAILQAHQLSSR